MFDSFLSRPIFDVRSPAEFEMGHLPGALNLPLFSNEERHKVGLCYKKEGRDTAVKLGLELVGRKLRDIVEQAESLAPAKTVSMYCWRGGMRSGSLAWLLRTSGFEVEVLKGGYKTWRTHVHHLFEKNLPLITVGGYTGSGKTELLIELGNQGEQVLDLEQLANHRGSAFGRQGEQPTTEHFENLLGEKMLRLDLSKPIWIEDESKTIGSVYVPKPLKETMYSAPFVLVNRSKKERIEKLCDDYGEMPKSELGDAFRKLGRRIGGQYLKAAMEHLQENNLASACDIALSYYDKAYQYSLEKANRNPIFTLDLSGKSESELAATLIQWKNQNSLNLAADQAADAK
jgi:tRNA 2-selenouridine synthase